MEFITVLLPVFNGASFIERALKSILGQSYPYFSLLIIDDGSTDNTAAVLAEASKKDHRIKVHYNRKNLGLIHTLNLGINLANTDLIIRADVDDYSLPERFIKLVNFMKKNPDVGICGSWLEYNNGRDYVQQKYPHNHNDIKFSFIRGCYFSHGTAILRKSVVTKNQIFYNPEFPHAEDYEWLTRLTKVTKLANLPEILYEVTIHDQQVSYKYRDVQIQNTNLVRTKFVEQELMLELTQRQKNIYLWLLTWAPKPTEVTLDEVYHLISNFQSANQKTKAFADQCFAQFLQELWKRAVIFNNRRSLSTLRLVFSSKFPFVGTFSFGEKFKIIFKIILKPLKEN
ncbi:glycosyltransferase family 2 protein [Pontibacter sp. 13R65]|uniref:glycosyltransferase family 2 protein n=1 Tax=Pontibacter sp. 13R65 TaxID=3127458 RepID=UPI00301DA086